MQFEGGTIMFEELGAEDCRYGYFRENEKSKKVAEFFGFRYDSTYDLTRPWDGCVKTIESCIMTREEYESKFRIQNS